MAVPLVAERAELTIVGRHFPPGFHPASVDLRTPSQTCTLQSGTLFALVSHDPSDTCSIASPDFDENGMFDVQAGATVEVRIYQCPS